MRKLSTVKLTHSEMPFNMAEWYTEKSLNLIGALTELSDRIRLLSSPEHEQDKTQEELISYVQHALQFATMLNTMSMGSAWDWEDSGLLAAQGSKWIKSYLAKHAKEESEEESLQNHRQRPELFLNDLLHVANGPKSNRTKANVLLDDGKEFEFYDELSESLDKVNMGILTWEEFRSTVKSVTEAYRRTNQRDSEPK